MDISQLERRLVEGLEKHAQSSTKWAGVVDWTTETFGISAEEVRVSMLASSANKNNRLYEAFYYNPQVLIFVCKSGDDESNMTPDKAEELIKVMVRHLRKRWVVTPNLRTLIVTQDHKVDRVIKFRLEDLEVANEQESSVSHDAE